MKLDFTKLIPNLLPIFLRKRRMLAWLQLQLYSLQLINDWLQTYRIDVLERLTHGGQVILLERMLNIKFLGTWSASTSNPIYIEGLSPGFGVYLFTRAENQKLAIYTRTERRQLYVFQRNEVNGNRLTFTVWIPFSLENKIPEIRAMVNGYRKAGRIFNIKTY